MSLHKAAITIDPHEFQSALSRLHDPGKQSQLIKDQIELVRHRFHYIQTTPLKVLTQDAGFHKTLYVHEQQQLHCLLAEVRSLAQMDPAARANLEKGLYECLKNIVYDPALDFSQYELAKEIVSHRTVVCHIQIAALNIMSLMMTDQNLQSIEETQHFFEEIFTYFLLKRLTTAACVNNRVTQSLSLHFSYMPAIVSAMLRQRLQMMQTGTNHQIEDASFLNRLLTNFSIYLGQLEHYQNITQRHKIYDVLMFYKDLHEVDNADIELADEVIGVILTNKQALLDFFEDIFSF